MSVCRIFLAWVFFFKGYKYPAIYTVHVTGNYKLSFEVSGSMAILRCIGSHNKIDRAP